jgi:transposase
MINAFPKAKALLGNRGYDADWFREALATRKIEACIPSKSNRKVHIPHDTILYRQRHKTEIMFDRLIVVCLEHDCLRGRNLRAA